MGTGMLFFQSISFKKLGTVDSKVMQAIYLAF